MRSGSFSQYIKLYSFMFMHNISTTVVYVNGKYQANSVIRRITCNYLSAFVSSRMHRNVAFRSLLLPETIITSLNGTLADLISISSHRFILVCFYWSFVWECIFHCEWSVLISLVNISWLGIRIPHDLTTLTPYERIFKYSDIKPRG